MKNKYNILVQSFYNYITLSGLPPYNLTLEENTIIMLLIKLKITNQIMVIQCKKGLCILKSITNVIDIQL